MDKLDGMSMDIAQTEKEKLKAVFPQCFAEGKLDIDKLLSLCGEYIDNDFEKYKFEWHGKTESLRLAQKRSTGTLRPCPEESVNFDTTQNLYIEGDNLEVLKLLQTSYYRKVKMIYIDPPYNTGNDFVYADDFADPMARYKEVTQQATKSNPETMGRYHTNWLNMMYPRLRLAANLLRDDGVIFISIDDNEVTNLRKVCDEVFGEENFVAQIVWQKKYAVSNDDPGIAPMHEYVLVYQKSDEFHRNLLPRTEKYWTESGMLDKWMADPEMIAAEEKITVQLESGKIEAPPNPVTEVMRQIKMGATPEQAATAIVGITANITETVEREVTYDDAKEIVEHFEKKGYISKSGKMKDTMKNALLTGTLDLPKKYEAARERFESIIRKADSKPPIRDASRDVVVRLKKQVIVSPEFLELWNSIKHKTTYRVKIDTDELIERCVKDFQDMPAIPKMRLVSQTADIDIANYGVTHTAREYRSQDIQNDNIAIPNIVTVISEQTLVNRRVVLEIIEKSGRGKEILRNPQMFIEQLSEVIQNNCYQLDIDGISYQRLAGEDYYVQEIFETEELMANLDRNAVEVNKSVYDYVVYDSSTIEKPFAVALDNDPDVKLFFKIPERFKIQTPIGTYNPDWAVYLTKNGEEKLYFVLETKGSTSLFDLRTREQLKIHCGKKHFKALNSDVEMQVASKWDDFKSTI